MLAPLELTSLRLLALLCAALVPASLSEHDPTEDSSTALALDDLCAAAPDGGGASACALSARQLRGRTELAQAAPRAPRRSADAGGRRRRRSPGEAQDITAAEEAKLDLEVNATEQQLEAVKQSLRALERFENETRRLATEHPVVPDSLHADAVGAPLRDLRPRYQGRLSAPRVELLLDVARRRRPHFAIPRRTQRQRHVVQALDFLQQDMDRVRRQITWLDRLNDWTVGKIDNPNATDLKQGGLRVVSLALRGADAPSSGADEEADARSTPEPSADEPSASAKHLEEQLDAIKEELAAMEASIPELEGSARATRRYYLRKLALEAMADAQ